MKLREYQNNSFFLRHKEFPRAALMGNDPEICMRNVGKVRLVTSNATQMIRK